MIVWSGWLFLKERTEDDHLNTIAWIDANPPSGMFAIDTRTYPSVPVFMTGPTSSVGSPTAEFQHAKQPESPATSAMNTIDT